MSEKMCVYNGRPSEARTGKEDAVYDLLDKLGIEYTRVDHKELATMEECKEVDELLGINMCKNLFLCNSGKSDFYILLMPAEKKYVTKVVSKQIGSSRLSFAPEEYMEKYLSVKPGAVTVLGLMNDSEHNVKLLIDEDLLKEEYIACHPCVNTSSIKLKMLDVLDKFLKYTGHYYSVVSL